MKKLFVYKKSIVVVIMIVIVLTLGLSLLAFESRVIKVDNNNSAFCYELNKLAEASDPLIYPNVVEVVSYEGQFEKLFLVSNEGYRFNKDNVILADYMALYNNDIWFDMTESHDNSKLEIYLMVNSLDVRRAAFYPSINCHLEGNDLILRIIVDENTVITNNSKKNINSKDLMSVSILVRVS